MARSGEEPQALLASPSQQLRFPFRTARVRSVPDLSSFRTTLIAKLRIAVLSRDRDFFVVFPAPPDSRSIIVDGGTCFTQAPSDSITTDKTPGREHRVKSLRHTLLIGFIGSLISSTTSIAQETIVISSADDLARCSPGQLDAVFTAGYVTGVPTGPLRGLPLVNPGSSGASVASRGGRVVWSGKRIDGDSLVAVNRFFGLPMIRANVRIEPSLRDGAPAIVLDYADSSWLYRNVRDEIREVRPGLYLGYVDDTRTPDPAARRWFALEQVGQ